jgi:hypothetical protein
MLSTFPGGKAVAERINHVNKTLSPGGFDRITLFTSVTSRAMTSKRPATDVFMGIVTLDSKA